MIRRVLVAAALAVIAVVAAGLDLKPPAPVADTAVVEQDAALSPAAARATGERALALVAVPADLGFELSFTPAVAGTPRARTDLEARTITVYVRRGDALHRIAHDIAHEYGHAWDDVHMTPATRSDYLRSRNAAGAPWWPRGASDYASGAGDFAEVFAACRSASPEFRGRLAPAPADFCAALPLGAGTA